MNNKSSGIKTLNRLTEQDSEGWIRWSVLDNIISTALKAVDIKNKIYCCNCNCVLVIIQTNQREKTSPLLCRWRTWQGGWVCPRSPRWSGRRGTPPPPSAAGRWRWAPPWRRSSGRLYWTSSMDWSPWRHPLQRKKKISIVLQLDKFRQPWEGESTAPGSSDKRCQTTLTHVQIHSNYLNPIISLPVKLRFQRGK